MRIVVDASVAIAWALEDEESAYADSAMSHAKSHGGIVPQHWRLEVANLLVIGQRKGRLSSAEAAIVTSDLQDVGIVIDRETALRAFAAIPRLALAHRLTVYDAAYLELAQRLGFPLASLDKELNRAANDVGVELFGTHS